MGRPCTVCAHPKRADIARRLAEGGAYRRIAAHFGVSEGALRRHAASCISTGLAKAKEQNAIAPVVAGHARLSELDAELSALLAEARANSNPMGALAAIRELVRIVEVRARLFPDIDKPVTVDVLTNNPEWLRLQAEILRALQPFPDAQKALLQAIAPASAPLALPETTRDAEPRL